MLSGINFGDELEVANIKVAQKTRFWEHDFENTENHLNSLI